MSCLTARLERADTERALAGFFCEAFLLVIGHLVDLLDNAGSSLKAGRAVKIQLQASLNVPLNLLAVPRFAESLYHFVAHDHVLVPE